MLNNFEVSLNEFWKMYMCLHDYGDCFPITSPRTQGCCTSLRRPKDVLRTVMSDFHVLRISHVLNKSSSRKMSWRQQKSLTLNFPRRPKDVLMIFNDTVSTWLWSYSSIANPLGTTILDVLMTSRRLPSHAFRCPQNVLNL